MEKFFYFCAILGGVSIVLQFLASLFGFGGDDAVDSADAASGDVGDASGDVDAADSDGSHGDVDGTHFLSVFSVRSVSAGLAFLGIAGIVARRNGVNEILSCAIAVVVGYIATYSVYRLMRSLSSFNHDGSIKTSSAVGAEGVVYLTVPAKRGGIGKVTILQQERSMEYDAQTDSETALKSGSPIVVKEILTSSLLLVEPRVS